MRGANQPGFGPDNKGNEMKEQITAALESAIAATECKTGAWSVYSGDDYVQLVWKCEEDRLPEMYGDEPWSEWGGAAILKAAGLREFDDSGIDGYNDKFGEKMVSHWVQWNDAE